MAREGCSAKLNAGGASIRLVLVFVAIWQSPVNAQYVSSIRADHAATARIGAHARTSLRQQVKQIDQFSGRG
jgi:hypothetical protein